MLTEKKSLRLDREGEAGLFRDLKLLVKNSNFGKLTNKFLNQEWKKYLKKNLLIRIQDVLAIVSTNFSGHQ